MGRRAGLVFDLHSVRFAGMHRCVVGVSSSECRPASGWPMPGSLTKEFAVEDDVYEFDCGCSMRCLAETGFRDWQSHFCQVHSKHSLPDALARTRMVIEAKAMRKHRLVEAARNAPKPPRRSFAEMSAKGGFDL